MVENEFAGLSNSDHESKEPLEFPLNRKASALDTKEWFARKEKEAPKPGFYSLKLIQRFELFRNASKQSTPTKIKFRKQKLVKFPITFDKESGKFPEKVVTDISPFQGTRERVSLWNKKARVSLRFCLVLSKVRLISSSHLYSKTYMPWQ